MLFRIIVLFLYLSSFCSAQYSPLALTSTDKNTILDYHNKLRAAYGLGPLVWDDTLSSSAGSYSTGCVFQHSSPGNSNYGENLAVNGASPQPTTFPFVTWKNQLDGWKAEESSWTCGSNVCASGAQCGHLTAMIWNGTTSVGCGVSKCNPGTIYSTFWSQYLVCQYKPPGNWNGQHPIIAPLAPPCKKCPTLPTPQIIPSTGSPTAPINPPQSSPVAPLGSTKPKQPLPVPAPAPKSPPPAPKVPLPAASSSTSWTKCIGDYWPNNVETPTPCKGAPMSMSSPPTLYCDVGDPQGYYWPVSNAGTSDCYYFASLTDEGNASQDTLLGLTTPAWIGIAVGIAVLIIIIIVIIIIVKKRSEDERV